MQNRSQMLQWPVVLADDLLALECYPHGYNAILCLYFEIVGHLLLLIWSRISVPLIYW